MAGKSTVKLTALDKRLAEAARRLIAADTRGKALLPILEQAAPATARQISADRESPDWVDLWSQSRNFDEHANAPIVHPAIVRMISDMSAVPMSPAVGHAGLLHTYGYLFSTLPTPYGYKRERWTSPGLDRAFRFTQPTLRAEPAEGTLLTNVTYVFGRIVFRDRKRETRSLEALADRVPKAAQAFDYASLPVTRIEERVLISQKSGKRAGVTLCTDLVTPPHSTRTSEGRVTLLLYSVVDADRRARLITGFPVTPAATASLIEASPTAKNVPIRTRYNAFIPAFGKGTLSGTRKLTGNFRSSADRVT